MLTLLFLLLYDAKSEMRYTKGLYYPGLFQFDVLRAEMLEQSNTAVKEHGHQVNLCLVEEPGLEVLLGNIRGAHPDILLRRPLPG